MTRDEVSSFAALHEVFRLLGGKWDTAIISALAGGPLHWSEIRAKIHSYGEMSPNDSTSTLHDSILSRALQRMQRDGLVVRVEQAAVFPRSVTYALTPTAECLAEKLAPLAEWAMTHRLADEEYPSTRPGARKVPLFIDVRLGRENDNQECAQ